MSARTPTARPLGLNTSHTGSLKRKLQIFVEIPPSPLHTSNASAAKLDAFKPRATGTPLTNKALNVNAQRDEVEAPLKKIKLDPEADRKKPSSKQTNTLAMQRSAGLLERFPNGHFNCHNCRQLKEGKDYLACTALKRNKPCKAKYCMKCVRKHYMHKINSNKGNMSDWCCPKCDSTCTCWKCTRDKAEKAVVKEPVYVSVSSGKTKVVPSPSNMRPTVDLPSTPVQAIAAYKPAAKIVRAKKKQVVPSPKWTEVNTDLSRSDAEDRFFIREFILRFSPLMDISQSHLESLDEFEHMGDAAMKSYLIQVLGLIAADASPVPQKSIKEAMKKLSSAGFQPGAIWAVLRSLRDNVPSTVLTFPDPEETPSRSQRLRTVSAITSPKQLIPVLMALIGFAIRGESVREEIDNGLKDIKEKNKQLASSKKDENQRWADENQKLADEKVANEKTEGWDAKQLLKEIRAASTKHKKLLHNMECQHAFEVQAFTPRFNPLGIDSDGRIYYASTGWKGKKKLSANERGSLRKWSWFVAVWGKGLSSHKKEVEGSSENAAPMASGSNTPHEDDEEDCQWWGFADPGEIRTLAKWLAGKEGLNDKDTDALDSDAVMLGTAVAASSDDGRRLSPLATSSSNARRRPTKPELKQLVKALHDYADVLAWRIGDEKPSDSDSISDASSKGKGKSAASK